MNRKAGSKTLLYLSIRFLGDFDKIVDFLNTNQEDDFTKEKDLAREMKCNYVTLIDDDYPTCLKPIWKPPLVLYYYGDLSLTSDYRKNLSVVGSRECSPYGVKATKDIVSKVCKEFNIVSGGAKGIDTVAHQAALSNNGKTIVVLGSGIDFCYPHDNYELFKEVKEKGLIISEYPFKTRPNMENFPMRNRIITGLSKGLLVTEAYEKSGTLISVNYALQQDRDVMIIPYPIEANSACNKLIRDGAGLVENAEDVIYELTGK